MRSLLAAAVRLGVLGGTVAVYFAAIPFLFPFAAGDANIGAGLVAFGLICLLSFGWAVVDARRRGGTPTVQVWAVVAVAAGLLWLLALAFVDADSSMSLQERLRQDAFLAVFTASLVLVPAMLGAALGSATGGGAHGNAR
jgi:hypothetical protein